MNTQISQFCEQQIAIIDHNGQKWLTAEQLGLALGFTNNRARDGINNLYRRHADEFSEEDSVTIKLMATDGKNYDTRVFSLSGCNLISFFANTPRAKEFRAWAKVQLSQIQQAQPHPTDVLNNLNANMAQLASGMNMVLTQNQMVHKYIALLEMNQNTKRRVTPEDATLVKQLRAEGMSNRDVGRVLRISPTTVSLLNSDKYPFGKHDDSKPTIADVLDNMVRTEENKVRTMLGLLPNKELGE